jgi:hypothetical protein
MLVLIPALIVAAPGGLADACDNMQRPVDEEIPSSQMVFGKKHLLKRGVK